MIFDAHCYLGRNPLWAAQNLPASVGGAEMIAMMDRAGVDRALCAPPAVGAHDAFASDHELIASALTEFPTRIYGYARVIPTRGQAAIDELRYWVRQRGFRAVKFNTYDAHYNIAQRAVIGPVLEAVEELGVPVMVHTGESHGITSSPALVADLAMDFPRITFSIAHVGTPGFLEEVIPFMRRAENTVTDTSGMFRPHVIQDLVDSVGADRVLMGSNAPHMPMEFARLLIEEHCPRLTDAQREAILGGSALRYLGLAR